MVFSNERQDLRKAYFDAWQKHLRGEKLLPLEKQIVNLILHHPEYQEIFAHPDKYQDYSFTELNNEPNPFLHLGLHMTLLEQISTNRPKGITAIYRDIVETFGEPHHAEHHIIEILADTLWGAMQENKAPDEKAYIKQLKKLLKKGCVHHH